MEKPNDMKVNSTEKRPARTPYETPKLTRISNLFDLVGRGSGSGDATGGKRIT